MELVPWSNSANSNITQGQSDNAFCTGTNSARAGTGAVLGSGAYNMALPSGITTAATGYSNTDVILGYLIHHMPSILQQCLNNTMIWVILRCGYHHRKIAHM